MTAEADIRDRRRQPGRRQGRRDPATRRLRGAPGARRRRGRAPVRAPAAVEGLPARRGRARAGLRPRRGASTPSTTSSCASAAPPIDMNASLREVALDDGERLRYDRLLLATGAEPRRLAIPGGELDGVHYLRSVEDSDALRERLDRGGAVVVVGAGWIGAEVAASARQRGLEVTVVAPDRGPAGARAGTRGGRRLPRHPRRSRRPHAAGDQGRGLRGGRRRRARPHQRRAPSRLRLRGRRHRRAAAHATRRPGRPRRSATGSSSTSTCRPACPACSPPATSPAPSTRSTGERIRVEHWANALRQGPVAARNMLGAGAGLRLPAVLLLRPVRRRHGVLGLRSHLGPRRVPRRPRQPRVHRLLAGRRSRARRHERRASGTSSTRSSGSSANACPSTTGASRTPTSRSSSSPRSREARRMNRLEQLQDAGVSIWLDTLSRELLDSGALRAADRRLRGHGRDVEPDDLRQGDHRLRSLRRPASRGRRRRCP